MIMYLIEQNLGKVCKVSHMVEFNSENYSLVLIRYHCKENFMIFVVKFSVSLISLIMIGVKLTGSLGIVT